MEVTIQKCGGSQEKDLNLEELLSQITPENLHNEIFFGDPVGKEIW